MVVCLLCVLCVAEFSASGWSLVPRRPSECDVSVYDSGTSTVGDLGPLWLSRHGRKMDTHTVSWHRCAVIPFTCDPQYRMCHNQFLAILSVNLFSVFMINELNKGHSPALSHFRLFHIFPPCLLNFICLLVPGSRSVSYFSTLFTKFYLSTRAWLSKCFIFSHPVY